MKLLQAKFEFEEKHDGLTGIALFIFCYPPDGAPYVEVSARGKTTEIIDNSDRRLKPCATHCLQLVNGRMAKRRKITGKPKLKKLRPEALHVVR